jgi:hypothetical protein
MDLEQKVRAAFVLHEPSPDFEDVVMARLSAKSWRSLHAPPRRRRHFLLFSVMFVVAGAAAMGIAFRGELVPRVIAQSAVPDRAKQVAVPAAQNAAVEVTASAIPVDFTVHLRSLRHDAMDVIVLGKVREYYRAVSDGLRAIPGLRLVDDQVAEKSDKPASFRITIDNPDAHAAAQMVSRNEWAATFKVEVLKAGVYVPAEGRTRGGAYSPGLLAAQATGGPLSGTGCAAVILCSPVTIAAWQIKDLRMQLFPFDPSLQQELEARLLDSTSSFLQQREALNDLHDLGERVRRPMSTPVVRRVLQQIASEHDPGERGVLWYFLGGQRDPEIIPPLINAAQLDPDDSVRLGATSQLAEDFPSNPAVRAALQLIAQRDPVLLNRKVAERAMAGDAPWIEYVVATAKDSTQPVQQRLAPLQWMMIESVGTGKAGPGNHHLASLASNFFGRDKQVFIDLFARAGRGATSSLSTRMLEAISSLKHPETSGFLLAVFEAHPDFIRLSLLEEHLDDPQVRKRVEELAAESAIPTLQETAAGILGRHQGN